MKQRKELDYPDMIRYEKLIISSQQYLMDWICSNSASYLLNISLKIDVISTMFALFQIEVLFLQLALNVLEKVF